MKLELKNFPSLLQINSDEGRTYRTPEGNEYESVTTFLGRQPAPGLDRWRDRIGHEEADRICDAAAHRGNQVHAMCENYILGEENKFKSFDKESVTIFKNGMRHIIDKNLGKVFGVETQLYSDKLKLAGTTDLIGEWANVMSVIDWKTGDKPKADYIFEKYFLQETIYSIMLEEKHGIVSENLVVVVGIKGGLVQIKTSHRGKHLRDLARIWKKYKGEYYVI